MIFVISIVIFVGFFDLFNDAKKCLPLFRADNNDLERTIIA